MEIFVIGFPKSGTSTLQTALTRAGLNSLHWYSKTLDIYIGKAIYQNIYADKDPFLGFEDYQAITQGDLQSRSISLWPQLDPIVLRKIREYHPHCKFVLNYRDPEATSDSMIRWGDYQERLDATGAPGLPAQYARKPGNIVRWIKMHIQQHRHNFAGDPNFIEYDISDERAPKYLGDQLGIDFKWWGRLNDNADGTKKLGQVT